jgi:DNA-binding transcriptional ArsR family regulator
MVGEVGRKRMSEIHYRESRIARALGDPAKYTIINILLNHGPLLVKEISQRVRRAQPTVSYHLSKLKGLEIVRYETKVEGTYYWIKYPRELKAIIDNLRSFVKRAQRNLEKDT